MTSLEAMGKIYHEIKGYSEDVFTYVWDKLEQNRYDYKKIKLPHEYAAVEKASLEREFTQRRVRGVHYRK